MRQATRLTACNQATLMRVLFRYYNIRVSIVLASVALDLPNQLT